MVNKLRCPHCHSDPKQFEEHLPNCPVLKVWCSHISWVVGKAAAYWVYKYFGAIVSAMDWEICPVCKRERPDG